MLRISNKFKSFSIALLVAAIPVSIYASSAIPLYEIRDITPPQLSKAHLGKQILCHRPMRKGTPQMSVEAIEDKVVAHNFGHGGSGMTLAPGSAQYVIGLLEKSEHATDLTKSTPITIIGAGVMGLFSAFDLLQKGYKDLTIMAENFDDLTSHNAGGLLAPVSMDNEPSMQKIIDQLGIDAYIFYKTIATQKNPYFQEGAVIVPTYFETREESGLEPYVGKVMQPAKDVILNFGNGTTRKMVAYDDGIFIDTAKLMVALKDHLMPRTKFIQRKVKSFEDLDARFIVNCTGMGAKELLGDQDMVSVQGHLIMLKDQVPQNLQHMILVYFKEALTKSGQIVKRSLYMFPKKLPNTAANDVGVIGGTFIKGATAETPNEEEFDIMLEGAKKFYGMK